MVKEKKTKFVILGFLMQDPLSGYEIGEMIRLSTNHFWQESDASIYPTLKILAKDGLVVSKTKQEGKRKKEIFTITSKGKIAFLDWFKRSPEVDQHRDEFLLKFFFTDETTEKEMKKHSLEKLKELENLYQNYKEIEKELKKDLPNRVYWLKTLQIGMAHVKLDIFLLKKEIKGIYVRNST